MGIYFRKSVRVGPFKFNLSKSGIGVSAGIKGFRVGTGPKGNYVHIGAGGLYYKKSFSSTNTDNEILPSNHRPAAREFYDNQLNITHAPLEEIESATVFQMKDVDSIDLLNELNEKRKKIRFWPIVLSLGLLLEMYFQFKWKIAALMIIAISSLCAYFYDQVRKSTVLFYDLENEAEGSYESLIHSIKEMGSCNKIWHIEAQGAVYDKKYHGGASKLVKRVPTKISIGTPSFVKTNILVPKIEVGKQELHFFPDRVLVFENNAVGAVSYKNLDINSYTSEFIETQGVPKDSKVVGNTWQFVNKSGGPDRRFNNNPSIPIAEYGYIHFSSKDGLNELISLSRTDKGDYLKKSVKELTKSIDL